MKQVAFAVLTAALLAPTTASAQDGSRADPALRFLLMNRDAAARERDPDRDPGAAVTAEAARGPMPRLFDAALDHSTAEPRVRALVRVGAGGEAALLAAGAAIGTRAGDIVTARIPLDAVEDLLARRSIRAMEAATALRPLGVLPAGVPAGVPPVCPPTTPPWPMSASTRFGAGSASGGTGSPGRV